MWAHSCLCPLPLWGSGTGDSRVILDHLSASSPAIIIVFNLNDVASLEHTKYVRMLERVGGSEKEDGQGGQRMELGPERARVGMWWVPGAPVGLPQPQLLSVPVYGRQWLADALKENDPTRVLLFLVGSKKDLSVSV